LQGEEEEIVASERRPARIEEMRGDEKPYYQPAEQAGPALHDVEAQEFAERGRSQPSRHARAPSGIRQ